MTTFLLMWNIGLTCFCIRLLWDVVKLESKVLDLENKYGWLDGELVEKLKSIYDNSTIIRKFLEWTDEKNDTTSEGKEKI